MLSIAFAAPIIHFKNYTSNHSPVTFAAMAVTGVTYLGLADELLDTIVRKWSQCLASKIYFENLWDFCLP